MSVVCNVIFINLLGLFSPLFRIFEHTTGDGNSGGFVAASTGGGGGGGMMMGGEGGGRDSGQHRMSGAAGGESGDPATDDLWMQEQLAAVKKERDQVRKSSIKENHTSV